MSQLSEYQKKIEVRAKGICEALGLQACTMGWYQNHETHAPFYAIIFPAMVPQDAVDRAGKAMRTAFRASKVETVTLEITITPIGKKPAHKQRFKAQK